MILHALLLHLAMMRPVPPFVGTGKPRSAPCSTGTCSFNWSGSSGQSIISYNSGFADLSSGKTTSAVTLDGAGHVQIGSFAVAGARYTGSTSDTFQIVLTASPGSLPTKEVCVRSDGTNEGYCLSPCYSASSGHWARLCTNKNGSTIQQSALSSYDAGVDNTAKIVVSGTSTVTIQLFWNGTLIDTATDSTSPVAPGGNPGFGGGDGSLTSPSQMFGPAQDY